MATKLWIFLLVLFFALPLTAQQVVQDSLGPAFETQSITPMVANNGFSMESLGRGILGMVALLLIAFLFSANRKAIKWSTVG
ncbi:MAG: Na+ dependent nucleoside transporter N-terminal domain-containing protein, partial [Flavobacteriaceae bacterium]